MTVDYSLAKTTGQAISPSDTDRSARVYDLIRPLIFRMQPETAHHVTLALLRMGGAVAPARGLLSGAFRPTAAVCTVQAFGLTFPNPVGLAVGYDKDGLGWRGLAALGFGHIEIGTVTPRPQAGNPGPHVLPAGGRSGGDQPDGLSRTAAAKFVARRLGGKRPAGLILGFNIGKNLTTSTGARGRGLSQPGQNLCAPGGLPHNQRQLAEHARLRTLQTRSALEALLRPWMPSGGFSRSAWAGTSPSWSSSRLT